MATKIPRVITTMGIKNGIRLKNIRMTVWSPIIFPKSRKERVEALHYKHDAWFKGLPPATANTLLALARQFERGGTEELENPYVFNAPDVVKAGGYQALKILGEPKEVISEMKTRLFAV